MHMNLDHIGSLELVVRELLDGWRERLENSGRNFIVAVGHSSNEHFPLRIFLCVTKVSGIQEFSVTVDVAAKPNGLLVSSDAGFDDGKTIVDGPSAMIGVGTEGLSQIKTWAGAFSQFLNDNELKFITVIANMI
ncbi:hypothetical protein BBJ66_24410 [Rhizobium sp. RSm-3]|nr:hypothetical protein BBJ66_24410 [Rhizobium sp. RSm-3]